MDFWAIVLPAANGYTVLMIFTDIYINELLLWLISSHRGSGGLSGN